MALRLGEILVEKGIISQEELKLALKEQHQTKEMLGHVLVRMGFVTEKKMLQVLAQQQGIKFVDPREMNIADKVIKCVPAKFVWHYNIIPISIKDDVLTIAISNPFDMWPVDDLETNLGFKVEMALATTADIKESLKKYYGVGADTIERILSDESRPPQPADD